MPQVADQVSRERAGAERAATRSCLRGFREARNRGDYGTLTLYAVVDQAAPP